MKAHTKVYFDHFGYSEGDFIPCEITGKAAVDISHNKPRGMGGSKHANDPYNLMALCREAHTFLEQHPDWYWWFQLAHTHFMITKFPYAEHPISADDPMFLKLEETLKHK